VLESSGIGGQNHILSENVQNQIAVEVTEQNLHVVDKAVHSTQRLEILSKSVTFQSVIFSQPTESNFPIFQVTLSKLLNLIYIMSTTRALFLGIKRIVNEGIKC